MTATLIDGKAVAERCNEETRKQVAELRAMGVRPGLAVVLVGDDPASRTYVRSKARKCEELGLHSIKHELPEETQEKELLELIDQLNNDTLVHGILVQSPPPPHIRYSAVVAAIDPAKDIDGFHAVNAGKLMQEDPTGFIPCTPLGCQRLLIEQGIATEGAHAVILGRSMIVGKPLALLLAQKRAGGNATVTLAHSRTKNLPEITRSADILVAAIGRAEFVRAEHVKEGATVLDVGINRVDAPDSPRGYRLAGDAAFDEVAEKAGAITPVPGGIGPMTIAMLMQNTVKACCQISGIELEND